MGEPTESPPIMKNGMTALEMLADLHERVVRVETRQARQMRAQGMDLNGDPLPVRPPEHGITRTRRTG